MIVPDSLLLGDCLDVMKEIPDGSVDMILCDLPYGTTKCKWDIQIPFEPLWSEYKRIIKKNSAIILFSQGMFTADLMQSNKKMWKYNLIWNKLGRASGFLNAHKMPLREHEDICVFYSNLPVYNPIMMYCDDSNKNHTRGNLNNITKNMCYGRLNGVKSETITNLKYPKSIIRIEKITPTKCLHPTQKPVALCEYLIKTYTNEGDTVLDNCMGSGTTCLAALNTNRHYIGIEKDEHYFNIAKERIKTAQKPLSLLSTDTTDTSKVN